MYNLLSRRYILTKSKKLVFIKRKYDKKEYIINLLKKNLILEDNESYKSIADEILKSGIDCYTKYIDDFCSNRLLTKKGRLFIASILLALIKLLIIITVPTIKTKNMI